MVERLINRYRGKGLKMTPQRLEIIKFLDGNTSHPTADEIYREIKKRYPTISFATVYNTIEALREIGELVEVTIDPGRKHFDPNPRPHHHIMCKVCGRISDIFVDYSEALSLPAEIHTEYAVVGNHIDFYGVCKDCQKKTDH